MQSYYVYILASQARGTLYIGITNDLSRRLAEHLSGEWRGFTAKYNVHRLVHCEVFDDPEAAITREKQLKNWRRQWKLNLIEQDNPTWRDLGQYYRMGPEINSG